MVTTVSELGLLGDGIYAIISACQKKWLSIPVS